MRTALLLFGFGLALHALFWLATGDRFASHAAVLQGDAPVWQELAAAAASGADHELFRLPLRPPGMHWLVSSLWDGSDATAWRLRLVFVVLGATIGPLIYLLTRPHLREGTALMAGVLCAGATNLMALGSGPHSELPYLVLVLLSLFDQERLRTRPTAAVALRWGALHGVLTLLRAEHTLTLLAFVALLAWQRAPRWPRSIGLTLLAFALTLAPWQIIASNKVDAYNTNGAPTLPAPDSTMPGALPWDAAALARLATLPAFQQGPVFQFVTDTVRVRGRQRVVADDLGILIEAYGSWPQPLPRPFVCLYGGLNFFLGNSPEAAAGFSSAALDRAPPLRGGPTRYPPGLLDVLPRQGLLVLSYPPHLGRLVHGYEDGIAQILSDPTAALGRIGHKLWHAAEGAASPLGGYAAPIGLSGTRRQVDLVTAGGTWAVTFRVAWIALALAGLWRLRRQPWLWPWLLFAASKLVVTAAFFGYARQGALCTPVLMLGVAALLCHTDRRRWAIAVAILLLTLEVARAATTEVTIVLPDDGAAAFLAANDHREVFVRYE